MVGERLALKGFCDNKAVHFHNVRNSYLPGENVRIYYQLKRDADSNCGDCIAIKILSGADNYWPVCWPTTGKSNTVCRSVDVTMPFTKNDSQHKYKLCYMKEGRKVVGCSDVFTIGEVKQLNYVSQLKPITQRRHLEAFNRLTNRCLNTGLADCRSFGTTSGKQWYGKVMSPNSKEPAVYYGKADIIKMIQDLIQQANRQSICQDRCKTKQVSRIEQQKMKQTKYSQPSRLTDLAKNSQRQQLAQLIVSFNEMRERLADIDYALILDEYANITSPMSANIVTLHQAEMEDQRHSARLWMVADPIAQRFRRRQLEYQEKLRCLNEEYVKLQELLSEEYLLFNLAKYAQQYLKVIEWHEEIVERKEQVIAGLVRQIEALKPLYFSKKSFIPKIEELKRVLADRENLAVELSDDQQDSSFMLFESLTHHIQGLEKKLAAQKSQIVRLNEQIYESGQVQPSNKGSKQKTNVANKKSSVNWETLRWVLDDNNNFNSKLKTTGTKETQSPSVVTDIEDLFNSGYWRSEFNFSYNLLNDKKTKQVK